MSGTTYTESAGAWQKLVVSVAAPTPTPSPTTTPSPGPTVTPGPTPTPIPEYVYQGTYAVLNANGTTDTQGCLFLITTQSGQPLFPPSPNNALGSGSPQYSRTDISIASGSAGSLTAFTITNLGASSGSGTFTLDNGQNGTVTITSRTAFTAAARRALLDTGSRSTGSMLGSLLR